MTDMRNWVVLIVDDEPHNVGVAQKVLDYNGATVYTAKDGVEGLQLLSGIKPTFILLDLSMPNMDGFEMYQQVRAHSDYQHIPVIALTAHAMQKDRERVMDAGFNGYISKPFRIESFLQEINNCLASAAGRA
jgi:CheY-like chemotaxis protein